MKRCIFCKAHDGADEWYAFLELREMISRNPNDIKLIKSELSNNFYQKHLNSLSDLKIYMSNEFKANFFSKPTMRFPGDHKIKFSKKKLQVECIYADREVTYDIIFRWGYLTLIINKER